MPSSGIIHRISLWVVSVIEASRCTNKGGFVMKKVIIIGAGLGGLATALRLLKSGYNVSIYEKSDHVGGVVHHKKSPCGQYTFEYCASIGISPIEYDKVFLDCGLNPREYYEIVYSNEAYRAFIDKNRHTDLSYNVKNLVNNIQSIFPRQGDNYMRLITKSYSKYKIARQNLLSESYVGAMDNFKSLYSLLRLGVLKTAANYVNNYIEDECLANIILMQVLFIGSSPYKISNTYCMIPAVSQIDGIGYIKNGLAQYSNALSKAILEAGGDIYTSCNVQEICVNEKNATGIIVNDKFVSADILVANSDYQYTNSKLLQKPIDNRNYKSSCGTFILHLGIDKFYPILKLHNLFVNNNFHSEVDRIFAGQLPEDCQLYVYNPASIDDTICAKGKMGINVLLRVPNLTFGSINWDSSTIEYLKRICINKLSSIEGLEDIKQHIEYEGYLTPNNFLQEYNYWQGGAYGIAHTNMQSIILRPQVRSAKLNNLYFVGKSVHPGNGASIVLMGAEIATKQIIKEAAY